MLNQLKDLKGWGEDVCIKCKKPALLLIDKESYCVRHYKEEKNREEKNL